jgi:diguanylate cyclase (GGDEF)-like protein/PAS domain S-box-containing protein
VPDDWAQAADEQLAKLRVRERAASVANRSETLAEAAEQVLAEVATGLGWRGGRLREPSPSVHVVAPAGTTTHAFPVTVDGEIVAVVEFAHPDAARLAEADADVMEAVVEQLGRVAARERAAAELRRSEERHRAMIEAAPDPIVTVDSDGFIRSFNAAAERAFRRDRDEVIGLPVAVLLPERFRGAHEAALTHLRSDPSTPVGRTLQIAGVRADGSEMALEVALSAWDEPEGAISIWIARDVSDRRDVELDREAFAQELLQRALHDPLTALSNRALFQDRVQHALARAARLGSSVAVLAIDVDRFKAVNDGYGHQVGDQLLVVVAHRLQEALRPDDTVARVGSDDFAVLCEDVAGRIEAWDLAQRVVAAVNGPVNLAGHELSCSVTVGVALAGGRAPDPDELLREAEVAMEQARQHGFGRAALYEESMRSDAGERLWVEQDLRRAIGDRQLRLHYQPIVELASGTVAGVEALVRWEHPGRGLLLPQTFIRLAEDTGLIVPLGRWVLEEACEQAAIWNRRIASSEPLRVSVNVSARQFQQPGWVEDVAGALEASGLDPGQLVLEITESVLMEDTDTTIRRLAQLRALGVRIAIDDFGTGYSSLGYLRQFPVDILKVDKSFIDGVAEGPHESALARAVIKLAATLHLDAVAEGVSTRKQLVTLRRLRCGFAQGYYFSRPHPPEAIEALLVRPALLGDALATRD